MKFVEPAYVYEKEEEYQDLAMKQESLPAGNRKRCTDCGITCSSITDPGRGILHPVLAGGGGRGTPGYLPS